MPERFKADLHIHTVLSPCADLSMGPQDIVNVALQRDLDIIAVTDHNSVENVSAVMQAAENTSLTVIPGMEVATREDIHVVCLFPDLQAAESFQEIVYSHLPIEENDPTLFGPQYVCDDKNNVLHECRKILSLPTSLSLEEIAQHIENLGALFFPAHIDRPMHSLVHTLGFLPQNIPFYAVGIAFPHRDNRTAKSFIKNAKYTCVCSSDAHHIDLVGLKYSILHMKAASFAELSMAMKKENGRFVEIGDFQE